MGQVLHGCAKTTKKVRRDIQISKKSLAVLADQYGVNIKTVAKWKGRLFVEDMAMGPKKRKSTVLTPEEEGIIITFRKHTLLPLDDCYYTLQTVIPHLTRSSLHRCLQRHGISRLPSPVEKKQTAKNKFKSYPIGFFHIDIAEVSTEEGRLYLFVAIDRTSKFVYVELHSQMTKMIAASFLQNLIQSVPYQIHTILTDNGIQFCNRKKDHHAFIHVFERVCLANKIAHRLTKINHPWTNGQVERMNRTIKEATVKKYYYQSHDKLKKHLYQFILAYNHAKRLKTLKGLSPYEFICNQWNKNPHLFYTNPYHYTLGLNI